MTEGTVLRGEHISGTFAIHTAKGLAGAYGVDVFVTGPDTAVFVLAEIPGNPGAIITDVIEDLHTKVRETFLPDRDAGQTIWVERYIEGVLFKQGKVVRAETFDLTRFDQKGKAHRQPIGDRSETAFWTTLFGAHPKGLSLTSSALK